MFALPGLDAPALHTVSIESVVAFPRALTAVTLTVVAEADALVVHAGGRVAYFALQPGNDKTPEPVMVAEGVECVWVADEREDHMDGDGLPQGLFVYSRLGTMKVPCRCRLHPPHIPRRLTPPSLAGLAAGPHPRPPSAPVCPPHLSPMYVPVCMALLLCVSRAANRFDAGRRVCARGHCAGH